MVREIPETWSLKIKGSFNDTKPVYTIPDFPCSLDLYNHFCLLFFIFFSLSSHSIIFTSYFSITSRKVERSSNHFSPASLDCPRPSRPHPARASSAVATASLHRRETRRQTSNTGAGAKCLQGRSFRGSFSFIFIFCCLGCVSWVVIRLVLRVMVSRR